MVKLTPRDLGENFCLQSRGGLETAESCWALTDYLVYIRHVKLMILVYQIFGLHASKIIKICGMFNNSFILWIFLLPKYTIKYCKINKSKWILGEMWAFVGCNLKPVFLCSEELGDRESFSFWCCQQDLYCNRQFSCWHAVLRVMLRHDWRCHWCFLHLWVSKCSGSMEQQSWKKSDF